MVMSLAAVTSREIQPSKLPKNFSCFSVICPCRVFFCIEIPDKFILNLGAILIPTWASGNSFVPTPYRSAISQIFCVGARPKIATTIIKTITINVVNWRPPDNKSVHPNSGLPFPIYLMRLINGVNHIFSYVRVPCVLANQLKISSIYYCAMPARQRDAYGSLITGNDAGTVAGEVAVPLADASGEVGDAQRACRVGKQTGHAAIDSPARQ